MLFSEVLVVLEIFQLPRTDSNPPIFSPQRSGASKPLQCNGAIVSALTVLLGSLAVFLSVSLLALQPVFAETTHKVYFKGNDAHLDAYFIKGANPGPTLLLLGGIQGDEPGGYLSADLYADISLKTGNMIVVPRANFVSIVKNSRGIHGDMNRKFALEPVPADSEMAVVGIIKDLMKKSDVFLNLHDGSGFYSSSWESPLRNPMRFGQSIIADAAEHVRPDGQILRMESIVKRVLERVNSQISDPAHYFSFNNHMTLSDHTVHKEQRLSATFHALTKVGIPAFGIETSKNIKDFGLRVRYQTTVVNAFLDEMGIVLETPKICLESPRLKFIVLSINNRTPIVVKPNDVMNVERDDIVRIVHVEANYPRGITARFKGPGTRLDDMGRDVRVSTNTVIEVRKDRFLMAGIPVEICRSPAKTMVKASIEPRIRHFCMRVNDKAFVVEPGETLTLMRGDALTIVDPGTNLGPDDEKNVKIDLRGFRNVSSPDPDDDRGHCIDTSLDLEEEYGRSDGDRMVFPLQAKLRGKVFGESYIAVGEPKLEYVVLRRSEGMAFLAYSGDRLEIPARGIVKIVDLKTNSPETAPLFINMAGQSLKWSQDAMAAIDSSRLNDADMPLEITRNGRSIGKIWLKRGEEFRLTEGPGKPSAPVRRVRY